MTESTALTTTTSNNQALAFLHDGAAGEWQGRPHHTQAGHHPRRHPMTNQDTQLLDDAICLWLADHTNGHPCNSSHLNALAAPLTRPGRESWRLIDRRLQALRESGRISYVGKRKQDHGWRVSCQAATPPRN